MVYRKKELVSEIAKHNETTQVDAQYMLDGVFETFYDLLARGEDIHVFGFGKFEVVEKAGRNYKHPKTGEPAHSETRHRIRFTPAVSLLDCVEAL